MSNQTASDEQLHSWWKAVVKKHNKMHLDAIQNRHAGIWFTTNNEPMLEAEVLDKVAQAYQRGQADGEEAAAQQVITFIEQCQSKHIDVDIATWVSQFCLIKLQPPTKEAKG
jgi:hypothetical protein